MFYRQLITFHYLYRTTIISRKHWALTKPFSHGPKNTIHIILLLGEQLKKWQAKNNAIFLLAVLCITAKTIKPRMLEIISGILFYDQSDFEDITATNRNSN